ncbi:glutamyl-tRNA reductase [Methylohalomonas lacus]|uniref:Glutamyl-tRNA reductase n=1 Tax=Methylohalomonas lacus TaxID=398773 RepID=A0AAE3L0S0_9GAMM|nr:glutamyl-tRNA reductase [Methylohalomonas lacus]MCS3902081.1 glutamyl-tRNA reductase [Methylohalomonas lacus]
MSLLAVGLNHNTAPVALRERVNIGPEAVPEALAGLRAASGAEEAAILSTCNRTEVYCALGDGDPAAVVDWFQSYHQLPDQQIRPHLYSHPNASAVKHMMRVASGLDSMVVGEPQVLGQMKSAYDTALQAGAIGNLLNRLFQHSFSVAKEVRSRTAVGHHPVSVAFAAVRLAQHIFGDLRGYTALLLGAGETIELTARHLHKNGLGRLVVANRNLARAQDLAADYSGYAISLTDLPQHLAEADIIIGSTSSPMPLIDLAQMQAAIQTRKHRPVFIVDMAVPRDIDPAVGDLNDVYLYSVDDLREVIEENLRNRHEAALEAEEIINDQVITFMDWMLSRDAVSTIRALRGQAWMVQQEAVDNARRKLSQGADPERLLNEVTRALTNKLLHLPTTQLRDASARGRDDLLQAVQELYDLKNHKQR